MIRGGVVEEMLLPDLTTEARVKTWIVICAARVALGLGGGAVARAATAPPPSGGALEVREAGGRRALALTRDERRLLDLIAAARRRRGLKPLRLRASLYRAAKAHSRDMLRGGYFSHVSRTGLGPAARARRAGYSTAGYGSWKVGEVIGWGRGSRGAPRAIFRRWMGSAMHRSVLMGAGWRDIGLGCARGTFRGLDGVRMYTVITGRRVP